MGIKRKSSTYKYPMKVISVALRVWPARSQVEEVRKTLGRRKALEIFMSFRYKTPPRHFRSYDLPNYPSSIPSPTLLRGIFANLRSWFEAVSKKSRRSSEAGSKRVRRTFEELSKKVRRNIPVSAQKLSISSFSVDFVIM